MNNQESQTTEQIQGLSKELEQELQAALDQTAKDLGVFDLGVTPDILTPLLSPFSIPSVLSKN